MEFELLSRVGSASHSTVLLLVPSFCPLSVSERRAAVGIDRFLYRSRRLFALLPDNSSASEPLRVPQKLQNLPGNSHDSISSAGPKCGTRRNVLPARRHINPEQPNRQSITTLDTAIVAGAGVKELIFSSQPFISFLTSHMQAHARCGTLPCRSELFCYHELASRGIQRLRLVSSNPI